MILQILHLYLNIQWKIKFPYNDLIYVKLLFTKIINFYFLFFALW